MSLYARHNPATFDIAGLSPAQMDAVRDALAMLIKSDRGQGEYSDEAERLRLLHVAALEVIRATNGVMRQADGKDDGE